MDYEELEEMIEDDGIAALVVELYNRIRSRAEQDVKDELERIETLEKALDEAQMKLAEYEHEEKTAFQKAKNARIRELFGDYISTAWCVQKIFNEKPKCDKCNDERKIEYTTPRGKKLYEDCECAERIIKYEPYPTELITLESNERYGERVYERTYYTAPVIWSDGKANENTIERTAAVYDGKPFEEINAYWAIHHIFLDKETCERFCEYLNSKNETTKSL